MRVLDPTTLVSPAELAQAIGVDLETVNNWLRRDIIQRALVGRRKLRARLFSAEQVYIAAMINELVTLGIPPTPASEAVNKLWKDLDSQNWRKLEHEIHAVVFATGNDWTAYLYSRRRNHGPLYRLRNFSNQTLEEFEFPGRAFISIPISDVIERITTKLLELTEKDKRSRHRR